MPTNSHSPTVTPVGETKELTHVPPIEVQTPPSGLTSAQVGERVAKGQTNASGQSPARSTKDIIRAHVFTPFNGLLATLFIAIMITGRWQNGLFGSVIFFNALIGIVQELRARKVLDKLAVVNAPVAKVIRDGKVVSVSVGEVVRDDILEIRSGDQIVADGIMLAAHGLQMDESLLTGESDPISKQPGDEVRSGAIAVSGSGVFQATGVGADSYASRIANEAKRYSVTHSELKAATNKLLRWITIIMAVMAPIIIWRQWVSPDNTDWRDTITGSVAALVAMVPDGLVLLTSMAFVLGMMTLARRHTLVQELPAVEGLARVDVACLDKTGTLTYGDISLSHVEVLNAFNSPSGMNRRRLWGAEASSTRNIEPDGGKASVGNALALMNADKANATAVAIASQYSNTNWRAANAVPFSSARKWASVTAVSTEGAPQGEWVLGAPEMVFPNPVGDQVTARQRADEVAEGGSRVLVLARSFTPGNRVGAASNAEPTLPPNLEPLAIVELSERLREDAADTLKYFTDQGVALKVISGDNPRTVAAVAKRAGVPGISGAADGIDARPLPDDPAELARVVEQGTVFGRVTPAQKRAMVKALQSQGHVVAMTGDGVNDALALKDADIGVAMGSGSPATRAVAQLVLMDGKFAHLPDVVAEGRRVIANIERAANLFLVKSSYALVLAIVTAVTASAFPFEPIQMTLISALTIGVPGFFLALGPNRRRYVPGFLKRVLKFAVPTGVIVAAGAYAAFRLAQHLQLAGWSFSWAAEAAVSADQARTASTLATLIICLWVVGLFARPINGWKVALMAALVVAAVVAVAVPPIASGIFLLQPTWLIVGIAVAVGLVGCGLVELLYRLVGVKEVRDEERVTIRNTIDSQRSFIETRRQAMAAANPIPPGRVAPPRRVSIRPWYSGVAAATAQGRYRSLRDMPPAAADTPRNS